MSDHVEVSLSTLDHLRQELLSINDRQVGGLNRAVASLNRSQQDLEGARQRAEVELARAEAAYEACLRAAAAAMAHGGYGPNCSGLANEVELAIERVARIGRAIESVQQAAERFHQVVNRHRAYLSHAIPTMRGGLHARSVSIADYLSFMASAGSTDPAPSAANDTRALADDIGLKQKYGSFRIPNPTERREQGRSGERGG